MQCIGHDVRNVLLSADILQHDNPLGGGVSNSILAKVNGFGPLLGNQVTCDPHGSLIVSAYMCR